MGVSDGIGKQREVQEVGADVNGAPTSGSIPLIASGKGDLTATISWTDPEGKVGSAILNDRTPRLVNDLDIRIKDNAGTYLPFILDPAAPANLAKPGDNIRDNIEKIIIVGAIPGKSYELSYSHKKTLKDNAPQDYTIILSGIGGQKYCSLSNTKPSNAVQSISLNQHFQPLLYVKRLDLTAQQSAYCYQNL